MPVASVVRRLTRADGAATGRVGTFERFSVRLPVTSSSFVPVPIIPAVNGAGVPDGSGAQQLAGYLACAEVCEAACGA
jgi:hypothetical protein